MPQKSYQCFDFAQQKSTGFPKPDCSLDVAKRNQGIPIYNLDSTLLHQGYDNGYRFLGNPHASEEFSMF